VKNVKYLSKIAMKLFEDPFKFQFLYVIFYIHMTGYIWLRLGTNG